MWWFLAGLFLGSGSSGPSAPEPKYWQEHFEDIKTADCRPAPEYCSVCKVCYEWGEGPEK
jgi:hypothetical protein